MGRAGRLPAAGEATAAPWLLAAMALMTSLRTMGISRGAEMPILTISPSIRVIRISMLSPMTIASLTLRVRTSMGVGGRFNQP